MLNYFALRACTVLQTVIGEDSFPRTEVRGYRNYRLSGELCPMGSGALRALYHGRHLPPLCVPLRALGWGYDCFALRAMSLRDDVAPYGRVWRRCLACAVGDGAVRPACALSHGSRDCLWLMAYGLRLCGSSEDLESSRKQKS